MKSVIFSVIACGTLAFVSIPSKAQTIYSPVLTCTAAGSSITCTATGIPSVTAYEWLGANVNLTYLSGTSVQVSCPDSAFRTGGGWATVTARVPAGTAPSSGSSYAEATTSISCNS